MAEDLNLGDQEQIQQVARAGLEPGTAGLQVWHTDHSTMLTLCWWKSITISYFLGFKFVGKISYSGPV